MKISWKRNLVVLGLAQLLTMMGFSGYFPSIPYYFQELGGFDYEQAAQWTAAFQSGAAFSMMVASPIWGSVADRYGRKMMVVRASGAASILAFLMSFVVSPSQLVALRVIQGALSGTVSASMTLVATQTPEEHLGMALGGMQTVQFLGNAVGPLIGGLVADSWGYRAVFPVSSAMQAVAFLGVLLLVKESFVAPSRGQKKERASGGWRDVRALLGGNVTGLLFTVWSMSFAVAVVSAILSLYVKSLSPDAEYVSTLAGAMLSASALTSALAAFALGRVGDKYGQKKLLTLCAIGAGLIYVPQAFVSTPTQLLWLKATQGIFVGGMMPTANALLAKATPSARRGTVFGFSNSIQAAGRTVGPLVGAAVATSLGMPSVFLVTAGMYLVTAAVVGVFVRVKPAPDSGELAQP